MISVDLPPARLTMSLRPCLATGPTCLLAAPRLESADAEAMRLGRMVQVGSGFGVKEVETQLNGAVVATKDMLNDRVVLVSVRTSVEVIATGGGVKVAVGNTDRGVDSSRAQS